MSMENFFYRCDKSSDKYEEIGYFRRMDFLNEIFNYHDNGSEIELTQPQLAKVYTQTFNALKKIEDMLIADNLDIKSSPLTGSSFFEFYGRGIGNVLMEKIDDTLSQSFNGACLYKIVDLFLTMRNILNSTDFMKEQIIYSSNW